MLVLKIFVQVQTVRQGPSCLRTTSDTLVLQKVYKFLMLVHFQYRVADEKCRD